MGFQLQVLAVNEALNCFFVFSTVKSFMEHMKLQIFATVYSTLSSTKLIIQHNSMTIRFRSEIIIAFL